MLIPALMTGRTDVQQQLHKAGRTASRAAGSVAQGVGQSDPPSPRIINGKGWTTREDVPWMAYLLCDFEGFGVYPCAGTLVNDQYILTNAVCILRPPDTPVTQCRVILGGLTGTLCGKFDEPGEVEYSSVKVITHPKFLTYQDRMYDIGLLKLNTTVTRSSKIQPITLPSGDNSNYTGRVVTILGWPGEDENIDPPGTLQVTQGQVRDPCYCDWMWNCPDADVNTTSYDSSLNLCYGGDGTSGPCGNDDGGPVLVNSAGGFTQIAVMSRMRISHEPSGSSGCPSRKDINPVCTGLRSSRSEIPIPRASGADDEGAAAVSRISKRGGSKISPREPGPSARAAVLDENLDPSAEVDSGKESSASSVHRSPRQVSQNYECWLDTPALGTKITPEIIEWIKIHAV